MKREHAPLRKLLVNLAPEPSDLFNHQAKILLWS